MEAVPEERMDGRRARGERTRVAVAEALLDLIGKGDLSPTAERVAVRAGVSLRLVFHYFADLQALHAAAADRQTERIRPLLGTLPDKGTLTRRLSAFVHQRAILWERIAPVRRASLLMEPQSPEIRRRLAQARAFDRSSIQRVFRSELAHLPAQERATLLAALEAASSFQSWDQLRRRQGLSVERTRGVLARTLKALLQSP